MPDQDRFQPAALSPNEQEAREERDRNDRGYRLRQEDVLEIIKTLEARKQVVINASEAQISKGDIDAPAVENLTQQYLVISGKIFLCECLLLSIRQENSRDNRQKNLDRADR